LARGIAAALGSAFDSSFVTIVAIRFVSASPRRLAAGSTEKVAAAPARVLLHHENIEIAYTVQVTSTDQEAAFTDFATSANASASLLSELATVLPADYEVLSVEVVSIGEAKVVILTSTTDLPEDSQSSDASMMRALLLPHFVVCLVCALHTIV